MNFDIPVITEAQAGKMSLAAAARGTNQVHGLGAVQPLDQRLWKTKTQCASRVSFRTGGLMRTMAVANPNVKQKGQDKGKSENWKGQEASAVAMETVAKKAPVTAEYNVSHKDLPIENACKPATFPFIAFSIVAYML